MSSEDLEAMAKHVASQHCEVPGVLDVIFCPLCTEHVKGPIGIAVIHLARHKEEIALEVLPRGGELEDESGVSERSEQTDDELGEANEASTLETNPFPDLENAFLASASLNAIKLEVMPEQKLARFLLNPPSGGTSYASQRSQMVQQPVPGPAFGSYVYPEVPLYTSNVNKSWVPSDSEDKCDITLSTDETRAAENSYEHVQAHDTMSPPEFNIEFAPPSRQAKFETPKPGTADTLTDTPSPPDPRKHLKPKDVQCKPICT